MNENPKKSEAENSLKQQNKPTASATLQTAQTSKNESKVIEMPSDIPQDKSPQIVFDNLFVVDKCYALSKVIGMGSYGVVVSGINKTNGQQVAVKKSSDIFRDLGDTKRILREIHILKHVRHVNIIMLLDIVRIDNLHNFKDIYLVFELMDSNLSTVIKSNVGLSEEHVRYLIYQLLNGLYYMHSANIIHRDLKPENIFVSKKCQLKIGDLNLARKYDEEEFSTEWYRAPEILLSSTMYTKAIDIWSVGCILAELVGRTTLFKGKDYLDQFLAIVSVMGKPKIQDFQDSDVCDNLNKLAKHLPERGKVKWKEMFPKASDECLDLLDHMLVYKPGDRYTVEECLNHPFLQKFHKLQRLKCEGNIDWSFDKIQAKEQTLRQQIFRLVEEFRSAKQCSLQMSRKESQCSVKPNSAVEEGSPRKVVKKQSNSNFQ